MNMINGFNPIASLSFGAKNRGWKRLCLLFLLLLMAALPLKAAPVSVDSARTVAANVLGTTQLVNRTAEMPPAFQSAMYLFVPESGVGFALISADDCALPVLGYSTTSVIEISYMTGRYVSYLYQHYATQINSIRNGNIAASPEVAAQWEQWMNGTPAATGTAIAPMLTTRWDIAPDYQQLNPVTAEGVQCKVPAAGVAMGQVMKYWNHPERGTGRMSYTSNGYQLTAEFDTAYPWSDMPDALDAGSTAAQRDAVNLLLYHVGVAMRTSYGTGSSSPTNAYVSTRGALTSFFRYSPLTISTLIMTPNNESTWKARVMQDLNSSRPVIYILQTNFSFVVDGCDAGGRLHFNFGLGGKNDGYFTVGSINPGNFTYAGSGQHIVSGIRPCDVYTISVEANNDEWGSVSGSGTYWEGERLVLTATPVFGSRFRQWSDGNTDNPRSITATSDQTYTAVFEYIGMANIQAMSNNAAWGGVTGGGLYEVGENVVLTARPVFGSRFRQWSDGNTDNPRSITATSDQTYTAVFEYIGMANIQAMSNNAAWGGVTGGGMYEMGDNVELKATPVSGWIFEQWNDGSTENPRRFTATEDVSFTAHFSRPGVGDPQFHLVELDDRENHAWSYYSDPECLIRSLNPMDVRIRYFGYGENTMYSSDALQPEGEPDVDVSPYMVGIGIDAPWKNTYVYHKTLERVNGEQAESKAAADGPSFYRLIPNPYSRRPTHGTGDTRWRGFYKWRLKTLTGGSVYRDTAMTQPVTVGTMLDAEDTVFFMPAAEYGMEVDFEAIWARAVVFPTVPELYATPVGNFVVGKNSYERNIVVHNCNDCEWPRLDPDAVSHPYTLTFVHPDGTDGISPALLTEVPTYNISGIPSIKHSKVNPSSPSYNKQISCGPTLGPPDKFVLPSSEDGRDFISGRTLSIFGIPKTTIKFEYIKFSPYNINVYHCFIHRDCAIPETDTTWMFVPHLGGTAYTYYGDTIRGFKVYNGDTLYTVVRRALGKVGIVSLVGGHLICGRMCLPEEGCHFFLTDRNMNGCMGGTPDGTIARDLNQIINIRWRLESGIFLQQINFLGSSTFRGVVTVDAIIGSDYDRSLGDNSKLLISHTKTAQNSTIVNPKNKGTRMYNYVFKSGTYTRKYDGDTNHNDPPVAYFGPYQPPGYHGITTIVVEGSEINGIALGIDVGGDGNASDFVDYFNPQHPIQKRLYFKGGYVPYAVWGAGDYATAVGNRRMVFTGGRFDGWIAGGCNGTQVRPTAGQLLGSVNIYFGGRAMLQHDTVEDARYFHSRGGNLYGAGVGRSDATSMGTVFSSHIVVADSAYISRNVYGGGNYGYVENRYSAIQGTDIQILGGTVKGSVFGGANRAQGNRVEITMRGGHVHGNIYGGSNVRGNVFGPVTVRVEGGTVGTPGCDDSVGNVFGSGYGVQSSVLGDVQVVIGRADARRPHVNNPLIHGKVYGGGFNAPYNSTGKTFSVATWNGRIKKSVFGGGFGSSAFITGNTHVSVMGSTHVEGNVYGGGNMGKVTGDTRVVIGEDTGSYTLTVVSNNDAMGTVSSGGVYQARTEVRISAIPTASHRFKQWNDGNTLNPRTVTVTHDATYTAEFEAIPVYTITVMVADGQETMGTVSGGGDYMEGQAVSIRATPNTGYRFKQWSDGDTHNPRSFNAAQNVSYTAEFEEIPVVWVDLELPSGLQWAASNLGADNPEEYGDYFAWGETATKDIYSWGNYIYSESISDFFTKYCSNPDYGYYGYTDNLTQLQPEDDAATAILGGGARIPTPTEWQEMFNNTTQTNDTLNGVAGRRFTSKKNGNSIFIPYAGYKENLSSSSSGSAAYLWSSLLSSSGTTSAVRANIANSYFSVNYYGNRNYGQSIRAVRRSN